MDILCFHHKQTTPRRDEEGEYRRCLECGGRIPWAWPDDFQIRSPKQSQSRLTAVAWKPERKSA
jgi:hypothetical protein